MRSKVFEIRDRHTFIPVLATKPEAGAENEQERYLAVRGNFGRCKHVILTKFTDVKTEADPYAWGNVRMRTAHQYIEKHFDELESGAVVDVEFILGETTSPKVSERIAAIPASNTTNDR